MEYETHGVGILCLCPCATVTPMNEYLKHMGMTEAGERFLHSLDVLDDGDILRAEDVAGAALKVMGEGASGSVWYIHKRGISAWEVQDRMGWENLMACKPE